MKILFLSSGFNGLTQRCWLELDRLDHQVMITVTEDAQVMEKQVQAYQPDLIVAPYLKARIPASIWKHHVCLIIHPGIPGDRGSSSLDWAILEGRTQWGVTILQAVEKMDAGPVWSYRLFPMRETTKANLYRHEVSTFAVEALLEAIERFESKTFQAQYPEELNVKLSGQYKPRLPESALQFNWTDSAASILRKCQAADSDQGLPIHWNHKVYSAFGGHLESQLKGSPGRILAKKNNAICIACADQSLWFTHLREGKKRSDKIASHRSSGNRPPGYSKFEKSNS